jgi:large subunit ribosomal protein L10
VASTDKVEKVARLKERIDGSAALLVADYRGLTTADVMELRRSLVQAGTRFAVVKNTLMKRAVEESGISEVSSLLEGPTAVGFVEGDAVAAAKQLVDAARRYPALELKGAWVEGRLLGQAEAQTLATLDSREAMLSKVAGLAKAEMSKAAGMFQTLQGRFLGLLDAYRDKLPAAETAEETPVETAEGTPVETAEGMPVETAEGTPVETPEAPADAAEKAPAAEASAEPEAEAAEPDATTDRTTDTETETTEEEPAQPDGEE